MPQRLQMCASAFTTTLRSFLATDKVVLWSLFLLLITYMLNQIDRYTLAVVSSELEKEDHFGDGTGESTEYQLLAGPAFVLVYTLSGIPIGMIADRCNRKVILVVALVFWSLMTLLMGTATEYWELLLLRAGQGVGEAGTTPTASGLITDYFPPSTRATALGVYNCAIYIGFSIAYSAGNVLAERHGFRAVFYVFGALGFPVALLLAASLKEPKRGTQPTAASPHPTTAPSRHSSSAALVLAPDRSSSDYGDSASPAEKDAVPGLYEADEPMARHMTYSLREVVLHLWATRGMLLLVCAASVRNAAGYVWAYNANAFYQNHWDLSRSQIAAFMSWVPALAGCTGAILGGMMSDRLVSQIPVSGNRRRQDHSALNSALRTRVLVASQLLAAPCALGAILLPPVPWGFLCLVPCYVLGEAWVPVSVAILSEHVPTGMRITSVSIYFLVISNIAGNAPLLVSPFRDAMGGIVGSLVLLFPGLYLTSAGLFYLTSLRLSTTSSQRYGTQASDYNNDRNAEEAAGDSPQRGVPLDELTLDDHSPSDRDSLDTSSTADVR